MPIRLRTAYISSSSPCLSDTVPQPESLLNGNSSHNKARMCTSEQDGGNPAASMSKQLPPERVTTVREEVEVTNVNRGSSSSKIASNGSTEQRERNGGITTTTQVHHQVEIILMDEIEDSEEVVVSDRNAMDRVYSSSPPGQQSLPSARRSKRVSTMVSKEMEKYHEGCLVIIMNDGLPFAAGMIRKPDEDMLNHTNVDSGHDEYICEENGEIYLYVQIFEEPVTLKRFKIGDLQLFDADVEPGTGYWLKWLKQTPTVIANYKRGMKIANAASKYSVEERLRKFTLRVGTSIVNLLVEIRNVSSEPTTPLPPQKPNNVTVQSRDEAVATANGESSTVSVVRVKNLVIDTRRKLRETEEANKSLKMENSKFEKKIDELEATVRELKRQLDFSSGTSTTVLTLEKNLKLKDKAINAQEKVVTQLRAENLELQENLEKEREEKRECQENLEKMRSEFQKLEELFEDAA